MFILKLVIFGVYANICYKLCFSVSTCVEVTCVDLRSHVWFSDKNVRLNLLRLNKYVDVKSPMWMSDHMCGYTRIE